MRDHLVVCGLLVLALASPSFAQSAQPVRAEVKCEQVGNLMFADEGHGFAKKANRDYCDAATILFWQQYLLGGR